MIILNDTMEGLGKPKRQIARKAIVAKKQSRPIPVRKGQSKSKRNFLGKTKTGKAVVVTPVAPAPRPNFITRAVGTIVNGVQKVRTILPAKAKENNNFSAAELAEFQDAPTQPVGSLTPVAPATNVIAVSPNMEQIANAPIEPVGTITPVKLATQPSDPIAFQTTAEPVGDLKPVALAEDTDEMANMMREMSSSPNTPQAKNNTIMYVSVAALAVVGIYFTTKK